MSYLNAQFHIEGYQFPPFRKDREKHGGGKMVFVRNGIIAKRLECLEGKESETICVEFTISKKKWCTIFAYKPMNYEFLNELNLSLNCYG